MFYSMARTGASAALSARDDACLAVSTALTLFAGAFRFSCSLRALRDDACRTLRDVVSSPQPRRESQ